MALVAGLGPFVGSGLFDDLQVRGVVAQSESLVQRAFLPTNSWLQKTGMGGFVPTAFADSPFTRLRQFNN